MLRRSFFAVVLVAVAPLVGCGGSVASSNAPDAAPSDAAADSLPSVDSTPAIDSGSARDSGVAPDTPSVDAPTVSAKVRLADFLESSTGLGVCLVDGKTGTATSLLPAGVTGLNYEQVATPVDVTPGDSFEVRVVRGTACDAPDPIGGVLLADPIAAGREYTLGIFLSPGEGPVLAAHLWPDAPTPTTTGMLRAIHAMYTVHALDVAVEIGTGITLRFDGLHAGMVPTSSSMGTPSPEGYVAATDVLKVDVADDTGASIASFPAGVFGSGHMTLFATGSPDGTPTRPDAVLCYDDLTDGPLVRCTSLSP